MARRTDTAATNAAGTPRASASRARGPRGSGARGVAGGSAVAQAPAGRTAAMQAPMTPAELALADDRPGISLYVKLAGLFRSFIETGEWKLGARIPTVEELSRLYGAAGMTIRQALGLLEDEGLIERFRAKGTFVRARPERDLFCDVRTDLSGLLIARPGAVIEVLLDEIVTDLPPQIADHAPEGMRWRHLRRRHTRGTLPYLTTQVFVPEPIGLRLTDEDLVGKTATRLVNDLDGIEIADAVQILTVEPADHQIVQLLGVAPGFPMVRVVRRAYDAAGAPLLFAIGNYRSDTVRIEMKTM